MIMTRRFLPAHIPCVGLGATTTNVLYRFVWGRVLLKRRCHLKAYRVDDLRHRHATIMCSLLIILKYHLGSRLLVLQLVLHMAELTSLVHIVRDT